MVSEEKSWETLRLDGINYLLYSWSGMKCLAIIKEGSTTGNIIYN